MVSLASGLPITGIASGNISGRRCLDGGSITVCSGPVIEDGGGLYHLNAFDFDMDGRNIGFLFTASGSAVVAFTATTTAGVSGQVFLASGQSTAVNSGSLSGQLVSLFSGQQVNVYSGQLSGRLVDANVRYWQMTAVDADNTGQPRVTVGKLYAVNTDTDYPIVPPLAGGEYNLETVALLSGVLSGQPATLLSGRSFLASGGVFLASGSITSGLIASGTVFVASGPFVVGSITVASGTTFLASGQSTAVNSGSLSGQFVNVFSGQLSGHAVDLLSGRSYIASGSPANPLNKSGYALTSGGISDLTTALLQRNVSGLEAGAAKQSLAGTVLKLTAGFNATSGQTTMCDGSTLFMTQTPTYGSGMQPIRALGAGA